MEQIEDKESDEYIKLDKRSTRVHKWQYKQVEEFIERCGYPLIKSCGEADPQCAALTFAETNGLTIKGVITNDSDVLLYGGSCVIGDLISVTIMLERTNKIG